MYVQKVKSMEELAEAKRKEDNTIFKTLRHLSRGLASKVAEQLPEWIVLFICVSMYIFVLWLGFLNQTRA